MSRLPQKNMNDAVPSDEVLMSESDRNTEGVEEVGAGLSVRYAGHTAVGLVREHNEDNLVIANLASDSPAPNGEVCAEDIGAAGMMFAVCDGMGGAAAGEVASQMAVDILVEVLRRGGPPGARDDLARRLVSAVEESGKRIYDTAQAERSKRGMGTTATVAALLDKVLFLAEVGDSRAYLLREGELAQLTKDQSLVNQLIEAGHLTEEEAEAFEHSNIILQALGTSDSVQVDLTFVELRKGDRLMLCSDGLSGLVHDDSIRDALAEFTDPLECCSRLIEYAEAGGGHDNITVIIADFDGIELVQPQDTDSFGYLQYPLIPGPNGAGSASPQDGNTPHLAPTVPAPAEQGGTWSWIVAGLVALVVGGVVLMLSSSSEPAVAEKYPPLAAPADEELETTSEEVGSRVTVRVHTDVDSATLMVNGESHGVLAAGEQQVLSLTPGAYRFEAESGGDVLAVSVVTVRPDVPLDVHLDLPTGAEIVGAESPTGNGRTAETGTTSGTAGPSEDRSKEEVPAAKAGFGTQKARVSPATRSRRPSTKGQRKRDLGSEIQGNQPPANAGAVTDKGGATTTKATAPKAPVVRREKPIEKAAVPAVKAAAVKAAALKVPAPTQNLPGEKAPPAKTATADEPAKDPSSGAENSGAAPAQTGSSATRPSVLPANPF